MQGQNSGSIKEEINLASSPSGLWKGIKIKDASIAKYGRRLGEGAYETEVLFGPPLTQIATVPFFKEAVEGYDDPNGYKLTQRKTGILESRRFMQERGKGNS